MMRIYLKSGAVVETDDTLTSHKLRGAELCGLGWHCPEQADGVARLHYVNTDEIAAIVTIGGPETTEPEASDAH